MKKKLCIATYVFGKKYQGFIPLYIYSIIKNYPEYAIRIYIDYDLDSKIQTILKKLKKNGEFEVITNFSSKSGLNKKALKNDMISRSLRWFFYDPILFQYEYIYIGDIDVFICQETEDLCKQHIKHADFLNLPYSNCLRSEKINVKKDTKSIIKGIIKFGTRDVIKALKEKEVSLERLTGLHFIKTKEYYEKVEPFLKGYIGEMNLLAEGKSKNGTFTILMMK